MTRAFGPTARSAVTSRRKVDRPRPETRSPSRSGAAVPRIAAAVAATVVAIATILAFYRTTFLSGFDLILGDYGDTRFNLAVLEHAYRFATGQDSWRAFNFFYPVPVALGYSDALFLLAAPYVVARLVGLSAFNALQATLIAATSIAFFATLFFLRGLLRLGWLPALTGAAVFAGSSVLYQTLLS